MDLKKKKKTFRCAYSSGVSKADGAEKGKASVGIANDGTHLLHLQG